MVEQAFDQLRTKEQLGYIVFTGIKKVIAHTVITVRMIFDDSFFLLVLFQ